MRMIIDVLFSFGGKPSKDDLALITRNVETVIEQLPEMIVNKINIELID